MTRRMRGRHGGLAALWAMAALTRSAGAQLARHPAVAGDDVTRVEFASSSGAQPVSRSMALAVAWDALAEMRLPKEVVRIGWQVPLTKGAVEVPVCAGLRRIWIDGAEVTFAPGPFVARLRGEPASGAHSVEIELRIGTYEHRVACSYPPRVGDAVETTEGLGLFTFTSAHAREGGGQAVVYVPPKHDTKKPAALLVGLHPWSGSVWTYAAYADLLREARARDVVLLMPSGLGNSLYTSDAEDEVLGAIDALSSVIAVDPGRVSLWGASMGGAGATTIGFHRPDRFATLTSFFGDSKYDLSTYVKAILHDEAHAHLVNALDVVDNARSLPVWLIHGEEDAVSPIAQSEMLARALASRRFAVRFDRVPHAGHEGSLVTRFVREMVDRASDARTPAVVPEVTYTSVHPADASVYGIRFVRARATTDARIDLSRQGDTLRLVRASGVTSILVPRGAFGFPPSQAPPVVVDAATARGVTVTWDPLP